MAVDPSLSGRTFPPTPGLEVTEERLAAFAAATGTPYRAGDPAPATFPIVVAFAAMQALMAAPDVGIELQHVVHGQQKFVHERAVHAGDLLSAELSVTGLRQIGGADIINTSSAITDAHGQLVCTAEATLVHKAPDRAGA
jgi:acyl dehydratase